ncbi:metal ABC transporter solute-binding protein, Zn/Mn family [Staphylococcus carnosus]|uniref:ABC transporter substrate-binding protein n=1 Tax=Staphylococcus carnosus TaxID=1281 RepID=A0AAJ0JQ48_STACA|nr:zinc ABC transporter substrate-binding protein [Staphylococcus carnosus]KKB25938.1 ABC transporter substrate-binding protein [Staphylococcus carnosus]POA04236.1 ABC transporter substrate-binding protein [Staphylococcus carnosus]QQS84431.1 zinc ABC transporter substrate-binding protein [Staphylococcus carnosus]QRQ04371.1 zinc ABC transporter substrate-binding protein [Staphylococcus carnosus]UTB84131.1 ABC transporter substrate-binding protein [Staphylococcus carnosus]
MKKTLFILLSLVLTVALAACGNGSNDKDSSSKDKKEYSEKHKMKINTTVFAFQSFAEQIGGKYVDVKSIYPPGSDIHNFEPTQKEILNISKGDLFIYTSKDMDPAAGKIAKIIKNKDDVLSLTKGISKNDLLPGEEHEHEHEHEHGKYDPHIWLDPVIDQKFAKEIKDELVKKDPDHKDYYEKNYKKLDKQIADVDKDMKQISKDKKRDKVIISHDSLSYLAKRYNFEQEGVNGMNNDEPSQKEILSIVDEVKKSKQPYVLYEQNIPSKVTDIIRKETNTKPLSFHNLSVLTKDEAKDKDITYQSLMKKNIKSLKKALDE